MKTIQDRIIKLCEDAGISRHGAGKRLSRIANVSVKTGNKWLNGETAPTLASIIPLATFFGARAEWLATGEGDPYVQGKQVNVYALLSDEVAVTGDCSKLVISQLRTITLAALNGELQQQDKELLARIVDRLERKRHLKAA